MSKNSILIVLIIALVLVVGYMLLRGSPNNGTAGNSDSDIEEVRNDTSETGARELVTDFGESLKNVSLLGPTATEDIKDRYSNFVTPDLLNRWIENPEEAPGRLTSSPWPERIEIETIHRVSDTEYRVLGYIVETTSSGSEGDAEIKRPIEVVVSKVDNSWLISEFIRKTEE